MTPRCKNGPPITRAEIERRYAALRAAVERGHLDALLVCGNQYTGFEGAVRYVSSFEIVHRYAYLLLPLAGEPTLVFPAEARWIGDKKKPWVREQVWPEIPGRWLRDRAREHGWKRLGVVGLDFVMAVRDYRELAQSACEIVAWDFPFDMVRAVKSDWELAHIGQSMAVILHGFEALVRNFEPGKTEAEIMAPAVERFFAGGAGPRMMNIVLSGPHGEAEAHFKVPGDLMLYSRRNMEEGARKAGRDPAQLDLGSVIVGSIGRDSRRGRDGAREMAAMYLANKVQNIKGSADVLLQSAGLTFDDIRPIADAMEQGGRKAAARAVSDEVFEKVKPIAGTPDECIARIQEYRDAGCTHIMLEVWGEDREQQAKLFGEAVLPHFRTAGAISG